LKFYHPKKKKKKKKSDPPEGKKKKKTKPTASETQPWVSVAGRRLVARWVATRCLGSERWRDMRLVAGEILPARPNGDPKSPEGKKKKKKKPWVSQTHSQRDLAEGLDGRPGWSTLHRGFLPSSFFFSFLSSLVENQLL
jgi:hypothetical protein